MKKFLIFAVLALVNASLWAVPAKRTAITLTQGDGSTVSVQLVGDEHFHYYLTAEGVAVEMNEQNMLQPISAEVLSARKAQAIERSQRIAEVREERLAAFKRQQVMSAAAQAPGQRRVGDFGDMIGEKKGLVLLVNYTDKQMATSHNQAAFNNMFNQQGYNKSGHQGSVSDYFREQSYGLFNLTFDVVGPFNLSHNMSYYGNNADGSNDAHPAEMVIEALQQADSLVNYADYDWDGDGEVDQVFVIYAGYGEAQGASSNTIWPHEWQLSSAAYYGDGAGAQTLDGVVIDTYACSCELRGTSGSNLNGIGTACHEFSHCLGYPDLYDTDYSGAFGMDAWDLMDGGSYNGPYSGEVPAGFSSYERWMAGWLDPIEINEAGYVTDMPSVADSAVAYILYNEGNHDEYYLLENRQLSDKWFQYCGGHGMLVLHVDYDATSWYNNTVNDKASHQRLTIIPADGKQSSYSLSGDPYPGTNSNHALTNTSSPAATLYRTNADGTKYMNKPITDITETGGKISFTALGGLGIPKPTVPVLSDDSTEIAFSWQPVATADGYQVQMVSTSFANQTLDTLICEDMQKFVNDTDGSSALDAKLDQYFTSPGWTGYSVYRGKKGAKVGTSNKKGYLVSPAMNTSGELTVHLLAQAYSSTGTQSATVSLLDANKTVVQSISVPYADTLQSITFTEAASEGYHVKIAPLSRSYVGAISIEGLSAGESTVTDFDTQADTCFVLSTVQLDCNYQFKVRSVKGAYLSEWSQMVNIKVEAPKKEEETTAISQLDAEAANNQRYDLMGRKVDANSRGFIVSGGKIILCK